jgi:hypothetical protein
VKPSAKQRAKELRRRKRRLAVQPPTRPPIEAELARQQMTPAQHADWLKRRAAARGELVRRRLQAEKEDHAARLEIARVEIARAGRAGP